MSLRGYDQDDLQKKLNLHPPRQPARLDKITAGVDNTFSTGVHYWDRQGQPVLYLMIGRCDPTGLLDALKANASVGQTVKDVMWEFVIQVTRACEGIAEYQNKRIAEGTLNVENSDEGLIRSISVVVDLEGLSMKHLKKAILDLFQSCMVTLFSNYPDVVFRIVGVNCQGIVKFAYNLVKGSLDPGVRQKVSFHSSGKETTAALADLIEPKYIPTHYGGECTCEANCIASFDPANPKKHTEGTDSMDFEEKVKTEHVSLAAGEKFNKQFNVINGEDVLYDFAIESKKTADFSIYMIPTEAAAKVNLKKPSSKELKHYRVKHVTSARESDRYTATDVGVVLLLWENNGWFKEHKLQVCAFKEEKVVTREADAASNKTKEKEETKKGDNFSDS
ncbi:hypothetical protein AGDE_00430 [Angomonas deanei]|uniref:CRAL/TRIO domain containing protein, putative n=1 Tax=Angomonas deanei TaxID=59799 RepID=A0A7G2CGM1_9TRYP|nr:hypothetical protein AGDE_00430 [Angomonas deanei]CAD2217332.1 CRAL/TRIO domain containing protein, putative [Angomonas deanei]|eukprot:EPY43491.1 hypothetical protein AGDE_00430 [Angomonas deanei]